MLNSPKGTVDLLPGAVEAFQFLESTARRLFAAYDYDEIRTPILEDTSLFVRGIGATTDIVTKEMFTFTTLGDDSLTLRPEGTAGVVRALIQHALLKTQAVMKVYYIGPMFRYEKPQLGRQRQFQQIGVELFGVAGPEADAEVIALCARYLEALGFSGVRTRINSLGQPEERTAFNLALREYFGARQSDLDDDSRRRLATNPLRILDSKNEAMQSVIAEAPTVDQFLGPESKDHFDSVRRNLDAIGIVYDVVPRLVRGLDYYTRTVFETTLPGLGAQDSVFGGGRYDNLVEELGGPPTPALGVGIGMERLVLALDAAGLRPGKESNRPDAYLVVPDDAGLVEASRLCDTWRRDGVRIRWDCVSRSFRSGMKAANKSNARFAVLLGENERAQGKVSLKNLESGDQVMKTPDEALAQIRGAREEQIRTNE